MPRKKTVRNFAKGKKASIESLELTEYAQAVLYILKKIGFLTLLLTLPTAAILHTQNQMRTAEVYIADSERTAAITVDPEKSAVVSGEWFKVRVNIDTGNSQITEAKAVLRYNKDLLKIEDVNFASYAKNNHEAIDNNAGRAEIRSFFNAGAPGYFTGKGLWFDIVLSTHGEGMADFWFDCRRDAEDETNIMRFGGGDIVNCNQLGQGWFTVNLVNRSVVVPQEKTPCSSSTPLDVQNLTAVSGPDRGEVTLKWPAVSGATHYTVTYGDASKNYQYGSPDIGNTDQFEVKGLIPGKRYYFVVTAVTNCASSGYSNEASATAGFGTITNASYIDASPEKGIQPPIPPEFLPDNDSDNVSDGDSDGKIMPSEKPLSSALPEDNEDIQGVKPWQKLDFWLLAGGIALGGLFLLLVGNFIGKSLKKTDEDQSEISGLPEENSKEDTETQLPPWENQPPVI